MSSSTSLKILAKRLLALEDSIIACMKCGLCQSVCPMFSATMLEADVARGKLVLIDNLGHELLNDAEALADKLGRCLLCGSCQANCPSGVHIMDIFLEAREIVHTFLGLHPLKKLIFRQILSRPKLFGLGMKFGSPFQTFFFRKNHDAQETICAPWLKAIIGDRHISKLASKSLQALYPNLNEPRVAGGLRVAFFPGCVADKMYTRLGDAVIKVLHHYNIAVTMPEFACCGLPALTSGDVEGMLKQLAVNLNLLEDASYDYLLTPCASCTAAIKEYWPRYAARLGSIEQNTAKQIATKAMDINEFLMKVLPEKPEAKTQSGLKVTYHDSCHLKKSLGITQEPRNLIKASGHELVEMKEADRCCGCGGSFNLFHYDLSRQIGQRKRDNAVATGADTVAMSCPACMMQFEDVLSQNNDKMQVRHTVELYAESLGLLQDKEAVQEAVK